MPTDAGPALVTSLFLVHFCCLARCSPDPPQWHPRFLAHPNWQAGRSFPAVTDGAWLPTEPIVFYENASSNSLALQITVDRVHHAINVFVEVRFACLANLPERVVSLYKQVTICNDTNEGMPIHIRIVNRNMVASNRLPFEFYISLLPTERRPKYPVDESHRLRLVFYEQNYWTLESNWIYLKRWKWQNTLFSHEIVTEGVKDFLRDVRLSGAGGFDSKPLLSPRIDERLIKSDLLRSLTSFGVVLESNTMLCQGSIGTGLPIMSEAYPLSRHRWTIFKSFRIDLESGLIWYSRYGLKAGVQRLAQMSKWQICNASSSSVRLCASITGCQLAYNGFTRYSGNYTTHPVITHLHHVDTKAVAALAAASRKRECFLPPGWRRKIRIYAGTQSSPVTCPIICSMGDQVYGFFKDAVPLQRGNAQKFTRHGSVLVHQSGAFALFGPNVTHADSGQYMCSAEALTAQFEVEVVALPLFSVPNTALVGGNLPPRIHVVEGDGYTVNCTAFFSSKSAASIRAEFLIPTHRGQLKYVKMSTEQFLTYLTSVGALGQAKTSDTSFSRTLTLTVTRVPRSTYSFDFSHSLTCLAAASQADVKQLFMLPDYTVETGSDVVVVPRPAATDFVAKASPCCRDACQGSGSMCEVEFSLKPSVHRYLQLLGVEVRAGFASATDDGDASQQQAAWIGGHEQLIVRPSARLVWQMAEGLRQLSADKRLLFASLVPVFTYHVTASEDEQRRPKFRLLRRDLQVSDQLPADSACRLDSFCLFSTLQERSLSGVLSVAAQVGITREYLDSLPPLAVEAALQIPVQGRELSNRAKRLLQKLFNSLEGGGDSASRTAFPLSCLLLMSLAVVATIAL